MIIRNGLVWGDDFTFHEKDLYIDDATHTIVDKPVSEYKEILDAKVHTSEGATAPPNGLVLMKIDYN